MANQIARAVRVQVRREGFTVFERVLRGARQSRWRVGLVAAVVGAWALGLFGMAFVVPPLEEATTAFESGVWVHIPRTPIECTSCERNVPGADVMSWEVPGDFVRATVLTRGLLLVGAAALLLLLVDAIRARRPERLRAGITSVDEIPSDVLSSMELFATERGAIHLLHPDILAGTIERDDLDGPYRAGNASLVAAAEMTRHGPAIRLRLGDRVRARIGDLSLDVEALEGA